MGALLCLVGESDVEEIERNGRKRSGSGRCRVFGGSRDRDGFAKKKKINPAPSLNGSISGLGQGQPVLNPPRFHPSDP